MQYGNDSMRTGTPDFPRDNDHVVHSGALDEEQGLNPEHQVDDDAYPFGPDGLEKPASLSHKQWINIGIFVLMLITMIATGLVVTAVDEKKTSTLAALKARLDESISGRREILHHWIDSRVQASRRLTGSELVRLFVSDIALNPAGIPLPRSLLDQRPYFQTLMADFAKQNDLVRAAVIDVNGRLLLGSSGPPLDIASILARVRKAEKEWQSIVLPIRPVTEDADQLVIDVLAPMPRVQTTGEGAGEKNAIFVQTVPATDVLIDLLAVSSTRKETEKIYLIQERDDILEQISPATSDATALKLTTIDRVPPKQELISGRLFMIDGQAHYAMGRPIQGANWTIVHAVEADAALAAVNRFIIATTEIAIAIVLGASIGFAALWWRRTSAHHQELMLLYQAFADRLDKKRRFLAAITSSISDWLAVMNEEKRYIYVNPAFAAALDLPKAEILGRSAEDVLPLERFEPLGGAFDGLTTDEQVSVLHIGDRYHMIATSHSDLQDQAGRSIGTVTVMRDQTELVEQRQQRFRALAETIDAFVHTIERRDAFLLGHTCRLRNYAIAVGRKLDLKDSILTGIALAASLSQIGKIFIPDDILIKPKRHSQQEAKIMRGHIDHTLSILGRIDFGFPVIDILSQMHERLDGSGYPNGLSGDEIDLPGRILGAVDVFCARTAPRSYRDRLSAGHALFHLANNAARYDVKVIAALAEIVAEEGELNPDDFNGDFLDAQVWKKVGRQQHAFEGEHYSDLKPDAIAV
jgi:PAS domain S-box-containing protein